MTKIISLYSLPKNLKLQIIFSKVKFRILFESISTEIDNQLLCINSSSAPFLVVKMGHIFVSDPEKLWNPCLVRYLTQGFAWGKIFIKMTIHFDILPWKEDSCNMFLLNRLKQSMLVKILPPPSHQGVFVTKCSRYLSDWTRMIHESGFTLQSQRSLYP